MNILGLCSGLEGWEQYFRERGHDVYTVDTDPRFKPDLVADVRWLQVKDFPHDHYHAVLASPPCNGFSVASIGKHWVGGVPGQVAQEGITIVDACMRLCYALKPDYWVIENPMGMMRRILGKPTITTYFCCWGMPNMKPTDLWGNLPEMEWPKPTSWERAPRGSKRGTQRIQDPALRAKIPYELSKALCLAIERELGVAPSGCTAPATTAKGVTG